MKKPGDSHFFTAALFGLVFAFAAMPAAAGVQPVYLYNLADFTGTVAYDSPRVVADRERNEIYVLYRNTVRVFNDAGMEVYRFGIADPERIQDVAVNAGGNILTLVSRGTEFRVTQSNYRGEPLETTISAGDVKQLFPSFSPNRMVYHDGLLYLVDMNQMLIVIMDEQGRRVRNQYDVAAILKLEEEERADSGMGGFSVDREGNMVFTIPVFFKAYRLSPDGSIASFGQPGSVPGKFNIARGIARDSKGNYLVVDVGKYGVMIFDSAFRFVTQFGSDKGRPGELISPRNVEVDAQDRVYVSQARNKGVSVFRLLYD